MRSTSAKCDLTAVSSPLSQPIAIATAADHHLHTTSGPAKQNQKVQPGSFPLGEAGRCHVPLPVLSAEIDANKPKLIPRERSHPGKG